MVQSKDVIGCFQCPGKILEMMETNFPLKKRWNTNGMESQSWSRQSMVEGLLLPLQPLDWIIYVLRLRGSINGSRALVSSMSDSCNHHLQHLLEPSSQTVSLILSISHGKQEDFNLLGLIECHKKDDFWIKLDIDQTGLYKVMMRNLHHDLGMQLRPTHLSAIDRYGVLDDTYALCMAGKQKVVMLLHLIVPYKTETEQA